MLVAHKDGLVRLRFGFFEDLFAKLGCEVLVANIAEDMFTRPWIDRRPDQHCPSLRHRAVGKARKFAQAV